MSPKQSAKKLKCIHLVSDDSSVFTREEDGPENPPPPVPIELQVRKFAKVEIL
ncbi:hypothetical protein TVAG_484560 [Trichomonas vaginalis G3]|uniref:Uncharacterized protein n=1 Tax=Trichomonas vaginalis (strain ATCC PRA-98 / G3) TaxID=412133 RepID=A2F1Y4_TRIV3|nr:hypothetical protein TVAGG3_0128510 [Trichomonas vaginalis G3]EAY01082.1 hypothetical protein TVAG_484560 [Trichomonas vaginalis G3]KAI5545935.1 hypothetical protein TVAGG3_0128510 [Trichomonas vaginalis G3]|eukprot:XP_001330098.1 hypothetical protein [Trichomonas vaginalis G3]